MILDILLRLFHCAPNGHISRFAIDSTSKFHFESYILKDESTWKECYRFDEDNSTSIRLSKLMKYWWVVQKVFLMSFHSHFSTRIYWNRSLTACDPFDIFAKLIKLYASSLTCFCVAITTEFERFQNFKTNFLKSDNLFQKAGVLFFSWKHHDWKRNISIQNCPLRSQCKGK